jgi:hypothetical protein
VGFTHLGWDMSHQGMVFKAPKARALSGLKSYECLLCSEARAGPKNGSGMWRTMGAHLKANDTWTEHNVLGRSGMVA